MDWRSLLTEFDRRVSLPSIKDLVSNRADTETSRSESVEASGKQSFLSPDARSQFATIRKAVGEQFVIWPQARLCDFIVLEDAIENFAAAPMMESSKVPFVLCDPTTFAPKCVIRFEETKTNFFSPSERHNREINDKQDDVFACIGLPVVLIDHEMHSAKAVRSRIATTLDPSPQESPRMDQSHVGSPLISNVLVSNVLAAVRTPIAKAASLAMPQREIRE